MCGNWAHGQLCGRATQEVAPPPSLWLALVRLFTTKTVEAKKEKLRSCWLMPFPCVGIDPRDRAIATRSAGEQDWSVNLSRIAPAAAFI